MAAEPGAHVQAVYALNPVQHRMGVRGGGVQAGVPGVVGCFRHRWNPPGQSGPDVLDKSLTGPGCKYLRVFDVVFRVAVSHECQTVALRSEINQVGDVPSARVERHQVQWPVEVDNLVAGGLQRKVYAQIHQEPAAPGTGCHHGHRSLNALFLCGYRNHFARDDLHADSRAFEEDPRPKIPGAD